MAQLIVRNLEPRVKAQLQRRARKNRRSMEDEARAILRRAVAAEEPPEPLGTGITKLFASIGLEEPIRELRGQKLRPVRFRK